MNHDGVNHTSYASQSPPNGNSVISHLSILPHALITTIADLIPLKSPPNPIQPIKLSPKFSQSFHKFASIMAQRTENEETQFKLIPETLCGGVVGAPATNNSLKSPSFSDGSVVLDEELKNTKRVEAVKVVVKREVNRCSGCRKRVGLTGFRCRCGELFCSEHRYSDRHDCSYDYKRAGREAIAKENPVVKAAKIVRI